MSRYSVHNPNAYFNFLKDKRKEINKVSPTFCLAKWLQSTILLYSGETHSCHHPSRHKIKDSDIKDNPKGIHNTRHKIKARRDMLNGIQTPECDYCWNIENLEHDHISDRIYKSAYTWALPYLDEVVKSGKGLNIDPTYLEVAFESTCNFKCLYCSPESSSLWQNEIKKFGSLKQVEYNLHDLNWLKKVGKLPIPANEYNPYIEAFWKWWPDLYPKLHTFRITGGEPLLSKHTWKIFDYIKEHPNPNLILAINTNCNVPSKIIDKLINSINEVTPNIRFVDIYTSLESTGEQAEYARSGLNYNKFVKNCYKILDNTPIKTRLHFMTTINLTSAPTFINFLKLIKEMRKTYFEELHKFRIRTLLSYLRWPKSLQLNLLNKKDKKKYGDEWSQFIEENKLIAKEENPDEFLSRSFYTEEADQIQRLVEYMNNSKEEKVVYDNMRLYIKQCDERRNTDFNKTFPELTYLMDNNYYG
jgi:pyruvate-formate lyase-activating enzyme